MAEQHISSSGTSSNSLSSAGDVKDALSRLVSKSENEADSWPVRRLRIFLRVAQAGHRGVDNSTMMQEFVFPSGNKLTEHLTKLRDFGLISYETDPGRGVKVSKLTLSGTELVGSLFNRRP